MKLLLSLLCFTTITASSQTKEPLLEKLKKTQDRLSGKLSNTIPNQGVGINRDQKPRVTIIIPETKKSGPGTIPNLAERYQFKPPIMNANRESMVIALPQDNMPCIVPNMDFWKVMPNAGNKVVLEKPIDPGIYLNKPKS
jgi:hypothetical protein